MANASEQFRQSDVTLWAIVTLVCAGLAVLSANVAALLPASALRGLHLTRLQGASVENLRTAVQDLEEELRLLRQENRQLLARFSLQEQDNRDATRRIGALELTLPRLLDGSTRDIDRSLPTASIGQAPQEQVPESAQPLPDSLNMAAASLAPMSAVKFGIALGSGVAPGEASATWEDLSVKLGTLLLGLEPLLADASEGDNKFIVAGPIEQLSEATALCSRLERVSIPCRPMPYRGAPLVQ